MGDVFKKAILKHGNLRTDQVQLEPYTWAP